MSRHAVLVVAFGSPAVLARLVRILDDPDIDFFVHVDRRTPIEPYRRLSEELRWSSYRLVERRRAPNWGSHRFVRAQLDLLAEAHARGYDRYHLVSGADLPLLTGPRFKALFDGRASFEYVGISPDDHVDRLRYFYPLQSFMIRGSFTGAVLAAIQARLLRWQERAGIDRRRRFGPNAKGSTWYSITHEFVSYVLAHQAFVRAFTRFTLVGDEAWLQTLLERSPFRGARDPERLGRPDDEQALRLIDWTRATGSSPHVWTSDDLPMLMSSDCVFARKFDPNDVALLDSVAEGVMARDGAPDRGPAPD